MFKYKIGKRDSIRFLRKIQEGEAAEMFAVVSKIEKDGAMFIPYTKADVKKLEGRCRSRLALWRKTGKIDPLISMSKTENEELVIYYGLRKRGRAAKNAEG